MLGLKIGYFTDLQNKMFFNLFKNKKIKYDSTLNDSIKMGFWEKFEKGKPFFVLAPMADVTDVAFRKIIAKY